ncbi:MAG: N-acetyltransferase [Halanaerobiales bacterium]|nr:N-acetyltransferase [Halanaerobiales bacterium]
MIEIREERREDYQAVRDVNNQAFNQPQEGMIIEKIRESGVEILSLVAIIDNKIVGHIFFSPVRMEEQATLKDGMGLAPMAVLPDYQQQGIGSKLIKEGIQRLKLKSVPYIIVLGHKDYYPKFGFETASKYGLKCQWDGVPDEAFMVMILDDKMKPKIHGVAKYRDEFDEE